MTSTMTRDGVNQIVAAMPSALWYGEMHVAVELLKSGRCDLDDWLTHCAPRDARPPHRIVGIHVLSSRMDGFVLFRVYGRASPCSA